MGSAKVIRNVFNHNNNTKNARDFVGKKVKGDDHSVGALVNICTSAKRFFVSSEAV